MLPATALSACHWPRGKHSCAARPLLTQSSPLHPCTPGPQASDPEFYRAADSLLYGQGKPSEAAVDRMVAELNDR